MTTAHEELDEIINSLSWIKVKQYTRATKDYQHEHDMLSIHHREETKFLIEKCRKLAKELKEERFNR